MEEQPASQQNKPCEREDRDPAVRPDPRAQIIERLHHLRIVLGHRAQQLRRLTLLLLQLSDARLQRRDIGMLSVRRGVSGRWSCRRDGRLAPHQRYEFLRAVHNQRRVRDDRGPGHRFEPDE